MTNIKYTHCRYLSSMIMINNILVEAAVYQEHFVCNIDRCKGICCIEGDFGAPLEPEEEKILHEIKDKLEEYVEPESWAFLTQHGPTRNYPQNKSVGTPIHDDGRCAYAVFNQDGSIGCGIEHAWRDGKIDFRKPVSCHLYPIRIKKHPTNGMEMVTYERWDICAPACGHGTNLNVKLHEFTKDALVRKYGNDFYDQFEATVRETD